jgi:phosphate starvation-inducible PhoH-like protein
METRTLEFENAHFLQSLFADDLSLLKEVEAVLDVRAMTRDAWVRFEGAEWNVEAASRVFRQLEGARRGGAKIHKQAFRLALELAGEGEGGDLADLDALLSYRLLGSGTRPSVSPRTLGQMEYLRAMEKHEVVFGVGPAGTGKTYLAMAGALAALKAKQVNRLILTRPAVEAGEALGFLPGDLKEKILPYLRPLYDALYDMLEPDEVEKFIERGMIEIAPLAYMRGRTLNNAAIVLDEAQNTTREQMFMFLTRLGTQSRCVITGDPTQIDLKKREWSGLLESMRLLNDVEGVAFVHFAKRDVVRHPVVQRIIGAYEKGRAGEDLGG